jgi:16S rRNA processing protein RimM
MEKTLFTLGVVTGVHGLKGFLKVRSFAGSLETFRSGLEMVVRRPGKADKCYTILKASPHKKGLLMQLSGVDRDVAETLVGAELLVDRRLLPEPEDDAYFWEDLIGLKVTDKTLGFLGTIDSIMETGSNDVFVVKNRGKGGKNQEILVPGLASVVVGVDLDRGEMTVDLPEGL